MRVADKLRVWRTCPIHAREDPAYDELENSQKRLKIIIKADKKTPYDVVKKVMDTLQELRQNRFSLITTLSEG